MTSISGTNDTAARQATYFNQLEAMAQGNGIKGQELAKEVASLLATFSLKVSTPAANLSGKSGETAPVGAPAIDTPDKTLAGEADLEKLIMYLQLENLDEQAKLAQERINTQKESIDASHKERKEKLQESFDEMEKAAKTNKFNKIFGWLFAAVMVVVAVAACVATGGIAIGPCIGAGIAVTSCVLSATGAADKIVKALSGALKDLGLSKQAADIVAQLAYSITIMVASIASCNIGGGVKAIASAAECTSTLASSLLRTADVAMKTMGIVSIGTNGLGTYLNYEAGMTKAELTEMSKVLAHLRQNLEESQDELQAILEQIQNVYAEMMSILNSATDTQADIAQNIGNMA